MDDGDAYPNSKTFTVAPGSYTVNRKSALNWFVTAIACTSEGKAVTDLRQRSIAITVAPVSPGCCSLAPIKVARQPVVTAHRQSRWGVFTLSVRIIGLANNVEIIR